MIIYRNLMPIFNNDAYFLSKEDEIGGVRIAYRGDRRTSEDNITIDIWVAGDWFSSDSGWGPVFLVNT
jgi:hypothetical protein